MPVEALAALLEIPEARLWRIACRAYSLSLPSDAMQYLVTGLMETITARVTREELRHVLLALREAAADPARFAELLARGQRTGT